ncbi:universal stress protein [Streptomyces sp. S465]|uniref:universal stress protein n=1 Tax=Streptomyces sp. S465 TaxID=2979468 RepID=UPI002E3258E2|nr:universal stress protein [Streptomyces sp. S465]
MADWKQNTERVVVGVDGSDSSKQALRRAVREAGLTGGTVEAPTAWTVPQSTARSAGCPRRAATRQR